MMRDEKKVPLLETLGRKMEIFFQGIKFFFRVHGGTEHPLMFFRGTEHHTRFLFKGKIKEEFPSYYNSVY